MTFNFRINGAGLNVIHDPFLGLPSVPPWVSEAICAQTDPELFFPEHGGSPYDAKQVCAGCPVRRQCLTYALEQPGPVEGVWGGLTEMERRKLRKATTDPVPCRNEGCTVTVQSNHGRAVHESRYCQYAPRESA